jgi:hypothetical protein
MAKTYDINGFKVVHENRGWAVYDRAGEEINVVASSYAARCYANWSSRLTPLALDGAIALDNQQVLPADVLVGEGTLPEPPRQ